MAIYDLGKVIGPEGGTGPKGNPGKDVLIKDVTVDYVDGESWGEAIKVENDSINEYAIKLHLAQGLDLSDTSISFDESGNIIINSGDKEYNLGKIEDLPSGLPNGGNAGQVLAKASDKDGDATWVSIATEINWDNIFFHIEDDGNLYVDMEVSDPSLQGLDFNLNESGDLILKITRKAA